MKVCPCDLIFCGVFKRPMLPWQVHPQQPTESGALKNESPTDRRNACRPGLTANRRPCRRASQRGSVLFHGCAGGKRLPPRMAGATLSSAGWQRPGAFRLDARCHSSDFTLVAHLARFKFVFPIPRIRAIVFCVLPGFRFCDSNVISTPVFPSKIALYIYKQIYQSVLKVLT